ncbi:MAG: NADP-dependent malic enzyme [Rickettsiales bacterium]|jgi:malate dehydrogenase (oxaloacetate-decarboxylating)(NADP+)|nr:NADP-dependent malic enzyme [Rickettsiales bacterium]
MAKENKQDDLKKITDEDALNFHQQGTPGKVSLKPTKPLMTQQDLALAYSPGVAVPCLHIHKKPSDAYLYTSKGNYVAVISNGTAVLGLGNLGSLASKPVMEGKSVLFKRFADIDSVDIEVSTEDPDEFINCVKYLGNTWGGINLEDIKAPECFIIEDKLRELMDIPVFHDDQHGTAIITLSGIINATHLTNRDIKKIKVVVNGAGAAGIACAELLKTFGVESNNIILCDTSGVIYKNRPEGMNPWKEKFAVDTELRTLAEAMNGADVFIGLSVKGAVSKEMVMSMAKDPIIFAMANPDPEITPEEVKEIREDAIMATGRSDYPNQVNNVMGFPYIFRGALDVQASTINTEMKIAAAEAIARLARERVPEEVSSAYADKTLKYGPEYIIPTPFDSRLIVNVPAAVAQAAIETKVARKTTNIENYKFELGARLNPTYSRMSLVYQQVKETPKRIIFSEGEEEQIIRAALSWRDSGYGTPILVGREKNIREMLKIITGSDEIEGLEIRNAAIISKECLNRYIDYLYEKNQRKGLLYRDCIRMAKGGRNAFSSCMLACGDGDALITGATRGYHISLREVRNVINTIDGNIVFGLSMIIFGRKTIFIADSSVNESPNAEELASITIQAAKEVEKLGYTPRAALLSFSNFGNPEAKRNEHVKGALSILDSQKLNFEYDGEMTADVAVNYELISSLYPFTRLTKEANLLIMPALNSANISSQLLKSLGGGTVIGPILYGLEKSVQIIEMG